MTWIARLLAAACLLFSFQAEAQQLQGAKLALVIGIADYGRDAPVLRQTGFITPPSLANALRDSEIVADALETKGFTVTRLRNGTRQELMTELNAFRDRLKAAGDDSVGLVYYAGHGVQGRRTPASNPDNFLIPRAARLSGEADLAAEAVSLNALSNLLKPGPRGAIIIVLDACRDLGLPALERGATTRGWADVAATPGVMIAYATAPGRTALDALDGERNGPYAQALAAELRAAQSTTLPALFTAVRRRVLAQTGNAQAPTESSYLLREVLIGEDCTSAVRPARRPPNTALVSVVVTQQTDLGAFPVSAAYFRCLLAREFAGSLAESGFVIATPDTADYNVSIEVASSALTSDRAPIPHVYGKVRTRVQGNVDLRTIVTQRTTAAVTDRFVSATRYEPRPIIQDANTPEVDISSDVYVSEFSLAAARDVRRRFLMRSPLDAEIVNLAGRQAYLDRKPYHAYRAGEILDVFAPPTPSANGPSAAKAGAIRITLVREKTYEAEIVEEITPLQRGMRARAPDTKQPKP